MWTKTRKFDILILMDNTENNSESYLNSVRQVNNFQLIHVPLINRYTAD